MKQSVSSLNLPNFKIQQLIRLGYNYVDDIDPEDNKLTNFFHGEFLIKTPITKNALDLYQEETTHGNIITFIKHLDDILGNGVPLKQITEFCGEPGSGKSQLSYLLCINVQFPYWCGGVAGEAIYLSTKYGFNPERIKDIATKSVRVYNSLKSSFQSEILNKFDDYFDVENITKKIFLMEVGNDIEFISAINMLENWILKNKNIKLIVIDSITAPIRFAAFEDRPEILNNALICLKMLAQRYNLAVVLTNEMTTKIASGNEISIVPSFGSNYYHKINTRIQLSNLSKNVFKAAIVKSASMPYKEISFTLP